MTDWEMIKLFMGLLFIIFGAICGESFALVGAALLLGCFSSNKKRVHRPRKA